MSSRHRRGEHWWRKTETEATKGANYSCLGDSTALLTLIGLYFMGLRTDNYPTQPVCGACVQIYPTSQAPPLHALLFVWNNHLGGRQGWLVIDQAVNRGSMVTCWDKLVKTGFILRWPTWVYIMDVHGMARLWPESDNTITLNHRFRNSPPAMTNIFLTSLAL